MCTILERVQTAAVWLEGEHGGDPLAGFLPRCLPAVEQRHHGVWRETTFPNTICERNACFEPCRLGSNPARMQTVRFCILTDDLERRAERPDRGRVGGGGAPEAPARAGWDEREIAPVGEALEVEAD